MSGPRASLARMTLDDLRSALPTMVVAPGDEQWDAARLFHSGIGEPDAVVRVRSVDDVRVAVRWASATGTPVLVRGGGHSAWGTVPGGLTIDLGALADVSVDGARVSIGGGATWGAVARTLAAHGLGISSGDTASVGVGGLTLGGGIGWMVRAWGLAIDQLVGAELVTASGDVVEVTASAHPDLFWALRGGGGNFGVVTRFDFHAHALPAVVFATLAVSGDARPVLQMLRDALAQAPRELTVTFMDVPPMDPVAPAGATITACWAGADEIAARAALLPILALDGVSEVRRDVVAYPDVLLDPPPMAPDQPLPGFVGGNALVAHLGDDVIDRLVSFREAHSASVLFLRSLGGAYADEPDDASAFGARTATWFAMAGALDLPGILGEPEREAAAREWEEIEPLGLGVYGNFTTSISPDWVPRIYAPDALARLARIKRTWDPDNVFSRNHNVDPASA